MVERSSSGGSSERPAAIAGTHSVDIVVLGISTGGPQALKQLIPQLPADFPVPVVIVMHMPVGYTDMYARRLDEISSLNVREAVEGDVLQKGVVLVAQAGRHLTFRRLPDGSRRHAPGSTTVRHAAPALCRCDVSVRGGDVSG